MPNYILYNKHEYDADFIKCMNNVFKYTKWIGIPVYSGRLALFWAVTLLILLSLLEAGALWKLFAALTHIYISGSVISRLSGSIFYANGLISLILTWKFIIDWKKVSRFWLRTETALELYIEPDKYIKRRVKLVYTFTCICACVEHILSMISAIGLDCSPGEFFQVYILRSHGFLVRSHEFNLWLAIPIFVLSKIATILWNLQDLVIILMSMGLASRYYRLNHYAKNLIMRRRRGLHKQFNQVDDHMHLHTQFWRKLREAYVRQAKLVRLLDKRLGPLILLSNLNNLYFICLQLYLGIRITNTSWISRLYYTTSLTWLLIRACSVVLAAAEINKHSDHIVPFLHQCSNFAYTIEIKRLINQLNHDYVALSGMGLFSLTRKNLLEVVAVVIKYELILLQYDN